MGLFALARTFASERLCSGGRFMPMVCNLNLTRCVFSLKIDGEIGQSAIITLILTPDKRE